MSSGSSSERIDLKKIEFKPLDPSMDRAAFFCGEPELDGFFHDFAGDHHERYLARVTIALYEGKIIGYYWLAAQSHASGKLSAEAEGKLQRIEFAPCIYLGMIGVIEELQDMASAKP